MVSAQDKTASGIPVTDLTPHFDTLPDVARRLCRFMGECGGEHFAIFLLHPENDPRRLVPSLDSDYPGHAHRTAQLAETLGDQFHRRAAESTRPFWWASNPKCQTASALTRCLWAEEVEPPSLTGAALALPLAAEREDDGVMVISGERMSFTTASLTELHGTCLQQFGLIARLRPTAADAPPQMSPREIECLRLTANGYTSDEIASRLSLSVHTTNRYLTNSSLKLNAFGKVHAVAKALRLGLID